MRVVEDEAVGSRVTADSDALEDFGLGAMVEMSDTVGVMEASGGK